MKSYQEILSILEGNLKQLKLSKPLHFNSVETGIRLCRDALHDTREQVLKRGFKNVYGEILFFKTIKPEIVGYLIYYINIMHIGLQRPMGSGKERSIFYKEYISGLGKYFLEHREVYQYYTRKLTHFDREYFTRNEISTALYCDSLSPLIDAQFSTAKDMVFAQIIGNIRTIAYLKIEIAHKKKGKGAAHKKASLKWSGSKVDLVELVYALQASGMVNNGAAGIKDLAAAVENIFDIKLGDYYRMFLEIRGRKGNQLKFLEILTNGLKNKIVEADR